MYLPWMGYFGLIDKSDVFVFLDDVQFEKQSWQNRNRIKTPKGWIWLTVPVVFSFGDKINEVRINNTTNWEKDHYKGIIFNYAKAPFFRLFEPLIERIYSHHWDVLLSLNTFIIREISKILGINKRFILSSELKTKGSKTDRLLEILKHLGAHEYISGPAAKEYIEIDKFKASRIKLYWFEFNHPRYPQLYGEFLPYLSILDLIFNTGKDAINYIRDGTKNALVLDECFRFTS